MPQLGLWHMGEGGPVKLATSNINFERQLEDWIEHDPGLLQAGLTIVGRQVALESGTLDLLARDPMGRWVVIELKRGQLYRDVIAQALDYASSIATMPYSVLLERTSQYSNKKNAFYNDQSLTNLGVYGSSSEDEAEDDRDVVIFIVGTGKAPGLDRLVRYLSGAYGIPLNLVLYDVFEMPDGRQILMREITDSEAIPTPVIKKKTLSIEEVCQGADLAMIGPQFRAVREVAERHRLHIKPFVHSIMYSSPKNRTKMLFTTWNTPRNDGTMHVWVAPEVFAEFYPVTEDVAAATLGFSGGNHLSSVQVNAFIAGIDALFRTIEHHDY